MNFIATQTIEKNADYLFNLHWSKNRDLIHDLSDSYAIKYGKKTYDYGLLSDIHLACIKEILDNKCQIQLSAACFDLRCIEIKDPTTLQSTVLVTESNLADAILKARDLFNQFLANQIPCKFSVESKFGDAKLSSLLDYLLNWQKGEVHFQQSSQGTNLMFVNYVNNAFFEETVTF